MLTNIQKIFQAAREKIFLRLLDNIFFNSLRESFLKRRNFAMIYNRI